MFKSEVFAIFKYLVFTFSFESTTVEAFKWYTFSCGKLAKFINSYVIIENSLSQSSCKIF